MAEDGTTTTTITGWSGTVRIKLAAIKKKRMFAVIENSPYLTKTHRVSGSGVEYIHRIHDFNKNAIGSFPYGYVEIPIGGVDKWVYFNRNGSSFMGDGLYCPCTL